MTIYNRYIFVFIVAKGGPVRPLFLCKNGPIFGLFLWFLAARLTHFKALLSYFPPFVVCIYEKIEKLRQSKFTRNQKLAYFFFISCAQKLLKTALY